MREETSKLNNLGIVHISEQQKKRVSNPQITKVHLQTANTQQATSKMEVVHDMGLEGMNPQ